LQFKTDVMYFFNPYSMSNNLKKTNFNKSFFNSFY
jgi:hypothetical protein